MGRHGKIASSTRAGSLFFQERDIAASFSKPRFSKDGSRSESSKIMARTPKNAELTKRKRMVAVLKSLLLEGLKGKGTKVTPKWWDKFRARLVKRDQKRSRKCVGTLTPRWSQPQL